jgi:hypothetical protein
MEKNTKILLGVGAIIAAYLILKPKKAVAQTSLVSTPNTTPLVFTERQQNINNMYLATDANEVIQNPFSVWNGDKFDNYVIYNDVTQQEIDIAKKSYPNSILAKSNYLVDNSKYSKAVLTTKTKDCETTIYSCFKPSRKEIIQIPIDDECYKYQNQIPQCLPNPDYFKPEFIETYTPDRTNWGTWGN